MTTHIEGQKFDYLSIRHGRSGGVDIVGWGEYEASSVLAGQTMKVWLDNVPDEAAARAWITEKVGALTAAQVCFSHRLTEPRVCVSHLSDQPDY